MKSTTQSLLFKLLFLLLCIIPNFSIAQLNADKLEYLQNLTVPEGLSHNGVTDILEDSRGYLWVATFDGLNKYDGYKFTVYKNTLAQKIFTSNRIRTIVEDKNGNLWIGTDEGIDVYNHSLESFTNVYTKANEYSPDDPIIRKIALTESGLAVCLTEEEGFFVFDENYKLVLKYYPAIYSYQSLNFIGFSELDKDNWLFATNRGLFLFNSLTKDFKQVLQNSMEGCNTIAKISNNQLLVLPNNGLAIVEYEKNQAGFEFKLKASKLQQDSYNALSIDRLGSIWLGTTNHGILRVNNLNKLLNNEEVELFAFNLENNILRSSCVVSNTSSGCWLGTFNEGIYQFSLNQNPFKFITADMHMENSLTTNSILSIHVMDSTRVSITANQGGEAFFNTRTHQFEALPYRPSDDRLVDAGPIYKDSRGDIWLGGGYLKRLYRVKANSQKIELVLSEEKDGYDLPSVKLIEEDKYGNLWLGAVDGLIRVVIDKKGDIAYLERVNDSNQFRKNKMSFIRTIYMDPVYDYIWVGTDFQGLYRIDLKNNSLPLNDLSVDNYKLESENENTISSNFVSSIIRVPEGNLWIGTERGGINKVIDSNTEKPQFITYSEKDGLSNNVVKNVLYDSESNLWITTNVGLSKYNTKENWFQRIRKQDGLPFEDFDFSGKTLPNGNMVLGGLKGFCYFNPKNIKAEERIPAFQFGKLKLQNKTICPGDTLNDRVLLSKSLNLLPEITLKHHENMFSLELISLHYSNPDNFYFKYKLSPLHNDWILIPTSKQNIDFNGLTAGEYTLEVMVSNSLNQWSQPYQLKINITPPFWKTPIALFLYFVVIFIIVLSVIKIRSEMLKLKHSLEIEFLEKNKIKEVDEAKFKFFSNISHEFKTPLTLISGPIDLLMDKYKRDSDSREKLSLVKRQAKKMSQLVDQVHDFRRSDKNLLKLNYSLFQLDTFIKEIIADFEVLASNTQKQLEIRGEIPSIYVRADKDKLEKIFNNLLSNAVKFTKEGDFIRINAKVDKNKVVVKIIDSGKGIDKDDLPYVFERFYQSQKPDSTYAGGSGIGLAFSKRLVEMHFGSIHMDSELGHGTQVRVELPIIAEDDDYKVKIEEVIQDEKINQRNDLLLKDGLEEQYISDKEFADSVVFMAEDNDDMRLFIKNILGQHFKVKAFTNGQELLDTMQEEWPDVIISDVLMPELNGFDLCSQVKMDIKTGHIPVVLLTACTSTEDQLKGLKTGADAYIKKPFSMQHLITTTENILKNRKLLRERFQGDFPIGLEKKPENSADNVFLEKLYNLITQNIDNTDIDINQFAKELYLNRTHFFQKVKALTNETPYELIKNYRLKKAAELLLQQKLPVTEVCIMTGFKSRPHFSRAFKAKYNVSPSKYVSETLKKDL